MIQSVFTAQDAPAISELLAGFPFVYVNHAGGVYVGGPHYERWLYPEERRALEAVFALYAPTRAVA